MEVYSNSEREKLKAGVSFLLYKYIDHSMYVVTGAAAYQLGNTSFRIITEVKKH